MQFLFPLPLPLPLLLLLLLLLLTTTLLFAATGLREYRGDPQRSQNFKGRLLAYSFRFFSSEFWHTFSAELRVNYGRPGGGEGPRASAATPTAFKYLEARHFYAMRPFLSLLRIAAIDHLLICGTSSCLESSLPGPKLFNAESWVESSGG
jgi:hypothetical protein